MRVERRGGKGIMKEIKLHSKATAMKCLGGKWEIIALDPDPNTKRELTEEYNCVNCNDYQYCRKLEATLS